MGRARVEDVVDIWETWLLALGAGHSLASGKLLAGEDLAPRRRRGDRPDESFADEELALGFRRGNEQAFTLLYARYRAPLLRFVRRTTPDPADLEELVQEIWMAVIRGR